MSQYDFTRIEKDWQKRWKESELYKVDNDTSKPKFYALDMFPYPSGAGLHVGHPLGYIASDIVSRYKRLSGFNVLHPMGYDAFGLPAEQYAIQTGQHPAITTENNIQTFRRQLDIMGFSFDWSREVRTSDPEYYRWTQWIFSKFFTHWYDKTLDRARSIEELIQHFEIKGSADLNAACSENEAFSADVWKSFSDKEKSDILNNYRLAFMDETTVNWCEALGTVLANEEVVNGVSERGGYPVVRKKMKQWALRITAYADRLISGLDTIDWTDSIKEIQRNWIGKSVGAEISFSIQNSDAGLSDEGGLHPSPFMERGPGGEEIQLQEPPPDYNKHNLGNAKEMRKEPTKAEAELWDMLRNNQLGVKFKRQQPIENFIADFVCLSLKLIVELDGEVHKGQKDYDLTRTEYLENEGYKVIRFWNAEVEKNKFEVRDRIKTIVDSLSPSPSPQVEREQIQAIPVFTTRPDTIFGATFMVLAPEYEGLEDICSDEQRSAVMEYAQQAKNRSEIDRMADTKKTGVFTGKFAINPFTEKEIPIWVSDYVLAGYGTGAIMAVPAHDDRDFEFATAFQLPIIPVIKPENAEISDPLKEAFSAKEGICFNSGFLNGLAVRDAVQRAIQEVENKKIGTRKIHYKLREAGFGRQRYWGEPFPIIYDENGIPQLDENLPVELPKVESYKPTGTGASPLAAVSEWVNIPNGGKRETDTMPGWAGSSWYFLRYMDPHNKNEIASKEALDYWKQVDLYVGGSEHATGHLLYSRFWTKFLFDLGYISWDEPFKKLVNQGMIQGMGSFAMKIHIVNDFSKTTSNELVKMLPQPLGYISTDLYETYTDYSELSQFVLNAVGKEKLRGNQYFSFQKERISIDKVIFSGAYPILDPRVEDPGLEYLKNDKSELVLIQEIEKMSKSKWNVVSPDEIIQNHGTDALRLYEMFLGPLTDSKPWNTNGIEGVSRFLGKFWRLFFEGENFAVTDEKATDEELKILHKTIKKITWDIENMSFNTSVSAFMVATNELGALKCRKREILSPLLILLAPFAPHITEELWSLLHNQAADSSPLRQGEGSGERPHLQPGEESGNNVISRNSSPLRQGEGLGERSIHLQTWPIHDEKYLIENSFSYPISINGKTRTQLEFPLDMEKAEIEKAVLADETVMKWIDGKPLKKIIIVKGRIVNVVV